MIVLMSSFAHISVLTEEVLFYLDPKPNKIYIDATLGGGGHSRLILNSLAGTGHLYSFDQDIQVINNISEESKTSSNWTLVHANFEEIKNYCVERGISITGGIVLDLGLSSIQLDNPERGFNFDSLAPLDMRLNPCSDFSADQVVNYYSQKDLADIIYKYGEENKSRAVAHHIVNNRPFNSCKELADSIKIFFAKKSHGKSFRIHPATKTFQALRIYVNRELEVLEKILKDISDLMTPGSRIVVISFHSLEDRIVKHAFKNYAQQKQFSLLTKKPITASENELKANPRSRSAKLRAISAN